MGLPAGPHQPLFSSKVGPPRFGAPRRNGSGGLVPAACPPPPGHHPDSRVPSPEDQSHSMEGIEVQGEPISPEEITKEAGWLTSHLRRGARGLAELSITSELQREQDDAGSRSGNRISRAQQQLRRQKQMPRQPPLPKEHIKVVLRLRTGLDFTKVSHAGLRNGVLRATGLTYEEAAEDLLRINSIKNIIVASTPSVQRAEKYIAVQELRLGEKDYEVTAYAAPPEDTEKRDYS